MSLNSTADLRIVKEINNLNIFVFCFLFFGTPESAQRESCSFTCSTSFELTLPLAGISSRRACHRNGIIRLILSDEANLVQVRSGE
jgi:hypothetical protein